jgi:signal transduction histidine kinase
MLCAGSESARVVTALPQSLDVRIGDLLLRQHAERCGVADDGETTRVGEREVRFDRFVSGGPHGGSGLGLAIARKIARGHGGELSYDGNRFVLRIVAADDPVADRA